MYDEKNDGYTVIVIDSTGKREYYWYAHRHNAIHCVNYAGGHRILIRGRIIEEYT